MTTSADHAALGELGDKELLELVRRRDESALGEIHDRFGGLLLGLARRILSSEQDAEEVVQEVFLHLWNQIERYDSRRSSLSTWLVLLTRSRSIDRLRSRKVVERTAVAASQERSADHTSPEGARAVLTRERQSRISAELGKLPPEQRQVLELAFYGGKTQSEIAAETGIPLGTVKTRTLLAMKKLRLAFEPEIRELL